MRQDVTDNTHAHTLRGGGERRERLARPGMYSFFRSYIHFVSLCLISSDGSGRKKRGKPSYEGRVP